MSLIVLQCPLGGGHRGTDYLALSRNEVSERDRADSLDGAHERARDAPGEAAWAPLPASYPPSLYIGSRARMALRPPSWGPSCLRPTSQHGGPRMADAMIVLPLPALLALAQGDGPIPALPDNAGCSLRYRQPRPDAPVLCPQGPNPLTIMFETRAQRRPKLGGPAQRRLTTCTLRGPESCRNSLDQLSWGHVRRFGQAQSADNMHPTGRVGRRPSFCTVRARDYRRWLWRPQFKLGAWSSLASAAYQLKAADRAV